MQISGLMSYVTTPSVAFASMYVSGFHTAVMGCTLKTVSVTPVSLFSANINPLPFMLAGRCTMSPWVRSTIILGNNHSVESP